MSGVFLKFMLHFLFNETTLPPFGMSVLNYFINKVLNIQDMSCSILQNMLYRLLLISIYILKLHKKQLYHKILIRPTVTDIIAFDFTKWFSAIHLYRNYFISVAFYTISIHNNQRPQYKFKSFQQITFGFFFARELCSWQYVLHKSHYLQVQNHLNLCSNLCKNFGTNFCIEMKRNTPLPFLNRQIFQNIQHI